MLLWSATKKTTGNQKPMIVELCILFPGYCRCGTKPIDGAIMLGTEKTFPSKIHHAVTRSIISSVLASS
jgi:hypothetical protein